MGEFNLNDIAAQFYNAGLKYSVGIQPYALKLFFTLLVIDIIVTWVQYTAEGQVDPSYFLGRMLKHVLGGGFIYLMIVHAFTWMNDVIKSFSTIGAAISGLPALSPQTVLQIGDNMAGTILNTPANESLLANLELAIVQSVCGFIVLIAFSVTAITLLLTLIEAYLVIGGGVLLLGFGGNRFTASAAEGYFPFVIRVGVRLLFFYLVLAVGVQLANQWSATLVTTCKPVGVALPWYSTYGVDPKSIMTTVCSGIIPVSDMLGYVALALVFATVCISVLYMTASLVGGSIGLALTHAFEAAYIARTIVRPITSGLQKLGDRITGGRSNEAGGQNREQGAIQSILAQHQRHTSADRATSAATTVLNPFDGQPPGYNFRGPNGGSPSPTGPALPPLPNNGPGAVGAALEYQPGRPGNYTRNVAVDISDLNKGNRKNDS